MALSQCPATGASWARTADFIALVSLSLAEGCTTSFGSSLKGELKAAGKAEIHRMKEQAAAEARKQGGDPGARAVNVASNTLINAAPQSLEDDDPAPGTQTAVGATLVRSDAPAPAEPPEVSRSKREISQLAALLLSRIAPLGVASARLCELSVRRANAEDEIRKVRAAEKCSGVVSKGVLHEAGRVMVEMDDAITRLPPRSSELKLKHPPLACEGQPREMATCMASMVTCPQEAENIGREFTHVNARFRGVYSDEPERELRAKLDTLRTRGAKYRAVVCEQVMRSEGN
jgi:hypothetical protein